MQLSPQPPHLQAANVIPAHSGHLRGQATQHCRPQPLHRRLKVGRADPQRLQKAWLLHSRRHMPARCLSCPHGFHSTQQRGLSRHCRHVSGHIATQAGCHRLHLHARCQWHSGGAAAQHLCPLLGPQSAQCDLQAGDAGLLSCTPAAAAMTVLHLPSRRQHTAQETLPAHTQPQLGAATHCPTQALGLDTPHLAVQAPRPPQRWLHRLAPVGGAHQRDTRPAGPQLIHRGQQAGGGLPLVLRGGGGAGGRQAVQLIQQQNAGRLRLGCTGARGGVKEQGEQRCWCAAAMPPGMQVLASTQPADVQLPRMLTRPPQVLSEVSTPPR